MIYRFDEIAINSTAKKKPVESDKFHYIGLEHIDSGTFEISRWGSDVAPIGEKLIMKKGDVLFGKRRAYQRKVAIAPIDGIFSAHGMVLRPKEDVICKEFFPFFMSSNQFMDTAIRISVGGLSPTINWKDLQKQEFELPPIEEQRVLAEKLWAAYELKEAYRKMIAATDEMVKSQFIEMQRCSNRSNTLGDFIARCTPDRCGNRGDLPTLSVTKERAIVFQDERFDACVASKDKSNYIIAPRGYLVQGIHIDESNFGIQNLVDEGIVSPAYKLWKFKNNDAIPELVEYYLRSEMAIKYFQRKFLGATVQRRQVIRKEDFLALPLNLPELDDQMKYYQFYRQADKSKFELRQAIDKIDKVMKSLLQ